MRTTLHPGSLVTFWILFGAFATLSAASGDAVAGVPVLPQLDTIGVDHADRAGTWQTDAVAPGAVNLLPDSVIPVAAFRLHRDGPVQLPASRLSVPLVSLRIRGVMNRDLGVYVVSALGDDGRSERSGYWLQGAERTASGLVMQLPLTSFEPDQDVFLVRLKTAPRADEYGLEADPQDAAPLGNRVPVVMFHGYDETVSALPFDLHRDRTFETFMKMPAYRRMQDRVKFYRFAYRPYMALPELGAHCADVLFQAFGHSPRSIVLLAHSAGGLVGRYAAADPRLVNRVSGIITLATPHHGSVSASILQANGNVSERLGIINALLMRRSQRTSPDTPALRSLRVDSFDAQLSAEAQLHFGMKVNSELAAFNGRDPNIGKIFAYMGHVHHLWGRYTWGIAGELYRRALAQFDSSWADADPVVHFSSGTFAGADVAAVRVFPGRSHSELTTDPEVLAAVLWDIRGLCRTGLAAQRDARFSY